MVLKLRIERLKLRIERLKLRIDVLKLRIDVLKFRIERLKLRIDVLKLRIDVLKLQIERLKLRIGVLKLQIDDLWSRSVDTKYYLTITYAKIAGAGAGCWRPVDSNPGTVTPVDVPSRQIIAGPSHGVTVARTRRPAPGDPLALPA